MTKARKIKSVDQDAVDALHRQELRRRQLQALLNADSNRPKPTITLPRISILESA